MWIDRRGLVLLAAGSLLLNVFLIGIIAGHVFAVRKAGVGPMGGAMVPAAHVRALPPDDKKKFTAAMTAHRDAIRAARKQHREAKLATEADIAVPGFDRAKVIADFASLRQANASLQEAVNAALVDALADLSPRSRAALVGRGIAEGAPTHR